MKNLAKSAIKSMLPSRWVQYRSGSDKTVCLTFDDGPHANTERILEILSQEGVQASFFWNGCQVRKYPDAAKKIVAAGHYIGNHFYDHLSVNEMDAEKMKQQVEDSEKAVLDATGRQIRAIRPTYGDWNLALLLYSIQTGRKLIFWSLDSEDGDPERSTRQSILARCAPMRGGDILLMHEDNPHTLDVLPDIIRGARMKGLEFSTVEPQP